MDGAYHRFGFDNQGGPDSDIHTQVLQSTANVVYKFKTSDETTIRPYLIGGGGVYLSEVKGDDDPGDSADFGLNAGAGLDLRLGAVGAFVEARFHNIFMMGTNTNSAFIPITVGVRLGGS